MEYLVQVAVYTDIRVRIDKDKFDEKFMEEFRDSFYPFHSIERHVTHIAQMKARDIIDGLSGEFIEGYGDEMGIEAYEEDYDVEMEIIDGA